MMKIYLILLFALVICNPIVAKQSTKSYQNPILAGFYPDPTICRVDDQYYLVNSSFSYFPGLPIFQSDDLVNWKQIGNILDREEQVNMEGFGVSRGLFAPTLRHHDGTFYLICTVVDGIGNFIVTAENPAGPWSNPVPLPHVNGIDPDIFFDDDGKVYITSCSDPDTLEYTGHRSIRMYELDLNTMTTTVDGRVLVDKGTTLIAEPIWCEGPHLYKIDDFYYLMCAEGGTGYEHSEVIFRSKSLDATFEECPNNPILTQRNLNGQRNFAVSNTGHADLVQTENGDWWAVFLGCRPYDKEKFNTGRETFLLPVTWTNGWPEILAHGTQVPTDVPLKKAVKRSKKQIPLTGNFTYTETFANNELPFNWNYLRVPNNSFLDFRGEKPGVQIELQPQTIDQRDLSPAFIGRRQQHTTFTAQTELSFSANGSHEQAGLIIFQNNEFYYAILKSEDALSIVRGAHGESLTLASVEYVNASVQLKMTCDKNAYKFYYKSDVGDWECMDADLSSDHLSTQVSGGFVGAFVGLYGTSSGQESKNKATFTSLTYIGQDKWFQKK